MYKVAIVVVPVVYLLNAFLIGRLIKRIKISSDGLLNTILGFFALFVILYCFDILLYSMSSPVWGYALAYSIIQGILLCAYIFNWKYLIIKPNFNIRKFVTFIVIFILVFGIWLASWRNIGSMFGLYWQPTIVNYKFGWSEPIVYDNNNILVNLSVFNISNNFWGNCFNITTTDDMLKFTNCSWTILASTIWGLAGAWIIDETKSVKRIVIATLCLMFAVVITLAFIETFAIPDSWLMLEIFIYILVMLSSKNKGYIKLMSLTIMLMAILATTTNAYFLVFALFVFTIYWAVRNNENSITYIIFLGWAVLNGISGFASIGARYFLVVVNFLYVAIIVIGTIVHAKIGTPIWESKVAKGISKHSAKIVYTFLGLFIALILVANLSIFYEKYQFDFSKIDYRNFLTFIYRIIWNIRIDNEVSIAVINSILYALFLSLIISFVVLRTKKNTKGYWFTKDVPVKLALVAATLFCNPLSVHVFNVATRDYSLNTSNLNMLLAIPFIIFFIQITLNYKKYSIDQWHYYWI